MFSKKLLFVGLLSLSGLILYAPTPQAGRTQLPPAKPGVKRTVIYRKAPSTSKPKASEEISFAQMLTDVIGFFKSISNGSQDFRIELARIGNAMREGIGAIKTFKTLPEVCVDGCKEMKGALYDEQILKGQKAELQKSSIPNKENAIKYIDAKLELIKLHKDNNKEALKIRHEGLIADLKKDAVTQAQVAHKVLDSTLSSKNWYIWSKSDKDQFIRDLSQINSTDENKATEAIAKCFSAYVNKLKAVTHYRQWNTSSQDWAPATNNQLNADDKITQEKFVSQAENTKTSFEQRIKVIKDLKNKLENFDTNVSDRQTKITEQETIINDNKTDYETATKSLDNSIRSKTTRFFSGLIS